MKRFFYTMTACALLATSSSSLASAKSPGLLGAGSASGSVVVMCHQPGSLNVEIQVRAKDVLAHLLQGDLLGGCPVEEEIAYPE